MLRGHTYSNGFHVQDFCSSFAFLLFLLTGLTKAFSLLDHKGSGLAGLEEFQLLLKYARPNLSASDAKVRLDFLKLFEIFHSQLWH
jgi:hypothetical protein